MRAHQLDADGVILQTIIVESLDFLPDLVDAGIGGQIGDRVVDGVVVPAQRAIDVPQRVPMLNAHLVLIEAGWWEPLQAFVDAMPAKQQLLARTYMAQALTMARDHELVLAIPAALGKTEADVDQLFIMAGALDV